MEKLAIPMVAPPEVDCCGGVVGPPADPHERPGYRLCSFVAGFVATPVGPVPRLATRLDWRDRLGRLRARLGWRRNGYRVAPGLYCVGQPDRTAPVLVTANYKLTLDGLRENLAGLAAWILVLDTRGINVWCAAAHRTFGTAELVGRLRLCGLAQLVEHRRLIVPQLGAPGVAARRLLKESGFTVVWGPVRAADLPRFLANGGQLEPPMRQVTFSLAERVVLIPVEVVLAIKPTLYTLAAMYCLSGLGPELFSPALAWSRWRLAAAALLAGLLSGTVLVPLLLPWLPGRAFYRKGLLAPLFLTPLLVPLTKLVSVGETIALSCLTLAVSSYGAMNFTGATPFASPSGVEREMRQGIPLQIGLLLVVLCLWLLAPFLGGGA